MRPGLSTAAASALARELAVQPRSPAEETECLLGLGGWAAQYTPKVALEFPDALLLEVSGSLKFFRGLERIAAALRDGCARMGLTALVAAAPTARGASWLAHAGSEDLVADPAGLESALASLPVRVMTGDTAVREALAAIGATHVGDLVALPRAGLARRFGPQLVGDLDRALGRAPDPRRFFSPPAAFRARLELPAEVTQTEALLFAARRLFVQLEGFLAARAGGVQRLALRLVHREARFTEVPIGLAAPARDAAHFTVLARERLGGMTLPEAVRAIVLDAGDVVPLAGEALALFDDGASAPGDWQKLVERLRARLGGASVHSLAAAADHRPERASQRDQCRYSRHEPFRTPAVLAPARAAAARGGRRRAASRRPAEAPRRTRAHRIGLVGRRRRRARLLRRPDRRPRARLGLPRTASRRRMVPAWPVCLNLPAYAELHCLSNFSFLRGASHPEELVARAAALGYAALAITDECSLAGVGARAPGGEGARPQADLGTEIARGGQDRSSSCSPRPAGYGNLSQLITTGRRSAAERQLSADARGPGCRAGRLPRAARPFRCTLPLPWRTRIGSPSASPAAPGSRPSCIAVPTTARSSALARARANRRPAARRRRRRAHARALAPPPAGRAHRGAPRQAGARMRPCALSERRAAPAAAHAPRAALSAGAPRRDAARRRALPLLARRAALRVSRGARAARRDAGQLAEAAHRGRPRLALSRRRARQGPQPRRARARAHRRAPLRAFLPHRARRGAVRARAGDPLPGPRLGGELGGLLRARHHRGRPGADDDAVRALRLARAQRAARHRRRLRAPAARGGDPVRLREVRPRPRRARRDRDQLPPEERAARRRQGARPRSGAGRPAREVARVVGPLAGRAGEARRGRLRRRRAR